MKTILLFMALFSFEHVPDTLDQTGKEQLYYKAQFAGNLGLISAGAGYNFPDSRFLTDINLGYLPKHINGVRVITFSIKPSFDLIKGKVKSTDAAWYLGIALNYSIGRNIHGSMPDYYPLDYYRPNAFHFNPFTGGRMSLNSKKKNNLFIFAELGTVDYEMWFALINRNIYITDIVNLAVGIIIRPGSKASIRNKEAD